LDPGAGELHMGLHLVGGGPGDHGQRVVRVERVDRGGEDDRVVARAEQEAVFGAGVAGEVGRERVRGRGPDAGAESAVETGRTRRRGVWHTGHGCDLPLTAMVSIVTSSRETAAPGPYGPGAATPFNKAQVSSESRWLRRLAPIPSSPRTISAPARNQPPLGTF